MNEAEGFRFNDADRHGQPVGEAQARAVGSPLPIGTGGRAPNPMEEEEMKRPGSVPPPGRALPGASEGSQGFGVDRAMGILRMALPFVQKILPILDGNFGTAVSNVLSTHPHPQAQPVHPPVDLEPVEKSLTQLKTQQLDLRNQLSEQNTSLKRVEDQLEMVREATDRNTLEQQELMEDLKAVGHKINIVTVIALILLVASIALNVALLLHVQRVLP